MMQCSDWHVCGSSECARLYLCCSLKGGVEHLWSLLKHFHLYSMYQLIQWKANRACLSRWYTKKGPSCSLVGLFCSLAGFIHLVIVDLDYCQQSCKKDSYKRGIITAAGWCDVLLQNDHDERDRTEWETEEGQAWRHTSSRIWNSTNPFTQDGYWKTLMRSYYGALP